MSARAFGGRQLGVAGYRDRFNGVMRHDLDNLRHGVVRRADAAMRGVLGSRQIAGSRAAGMHADARMAGVIEADNPVKTIGGRLRPGHADRACASPGRYNCRPSDASAIDNSSSRMRCLSCCKRPTRQAIRRDRRIFRSDGDVRNISACSWESQWPGDTLDYCEYNFIQPQIELSSLILQATRQPQAGVRGRGGAHSRHYAGAALAGRKNTLLNCRR